MNSKHASAPILSSLPSIILSVAVQTLASLMNFSPIYVKSLKLLTHRRICFMQFYFLNRVWSYLYQTKIILSHQRLYFTKETGSNFHLISRVIKKKLYTTVLERFIRFEMYLRGLCFWLSDKIVPRSDSVNCWPCSIVYTFLCQKEE